MSFFFSVVIHESIYEKRIKKPQKDIFLYLIIMWSLAIMRVYMNVFDTFLGQTGPSSRHRSDSL